MHDIELLDYIPSPSTGVLHLGPLAIHAYGFCIALGVVAAVWVSNARWLARGGTSEDITALATWGVPCGILGARLYHVLTDFELYRHDLPKMFFIWDGGLGIWGGIAGGVLAGALVGRRRGLSMLALMDMVAPGLIVAQAIGRWGNYFNQELFGGPTTLPWGLEIDPFNRPADYEKYATFHPTFLYESLWDLAVFALLIYIDRRWKPRAPKLFLSYVALYTFARFFIEGLRVDYAHTIAGLRVNEWLSLILFLASVALLTFLRLRPSAPTDKEVLH